MAGFLSCGNGGGRTLFGADDGDQPTRAAPGLTGLFYPLHTVFERFLRATPTPDMVKFKLFHHWPTLRARLVNTFRSIHEYAHRAPGPRTCP